MKYAKSTASMQPTTSNATRKSCLLYRNKRTPSDKPQGAAVVVPRGIFVKYCQPTHYNTQQGHRQADCWNTKEATNSLGIGYVFLLSVRHPVLSFRGRLRPKNLPMRTSALLNREAGRSLRLLLAQATRIPRCTRNDSTGFVPAADFPSTQTRRQRISSAGVCESKPRQDRTIQSCSWKRDSC